MHAHDISIFVAMAYPALDEPSLRPRDTGSRSTLKQGASAIHHLRQQIPLAGTGSSGASTPLPGLLWR